VTAAPARSQSLNSVNSRLLRLQRAAGRREFDCAKFARAMLYIIGFYCAVVGPLTASPTASANDDGANWINQAVWLSLAGSATVVALMNPSRFLAAPIMRSHVFLIALTGWFTLSAVWSLSPEATIRRVGLQIVIMITVAICVVLVREARIIFNDILRLLVLVVIINWLALVLLPPTPIGHAGIYLSKNNFGTFAALMVLLGASRLGAGSVTMRLMALFVTASGFVFLAVSAAKTSIGLALLVPALSIFVLRFPLFRARAAVVATLLAFISLIVVVAIMSSFSLTTDDLFTILFGDPTFTGRTSIWAFVWSYIETRPWLGYGFGGFWSIGTAAPVMQTGLWWMKDVINQSHNLYIDLLVQGGVIALVLFLAHIVMLIANSSKLSGWHWSDKLSVASIVFYSLIYNLMDTTLFRSFNIDWIYFLACSFLIGLGPLAGRREAATSESRPAAVRRG
jgi:exopolysaccharide production protein ExoQ